MKKSFLTIAALATGIAAAATFAGPANAACLNSVWNKSSGNGFAEVIRGRDCNGDMSVRFSGALGDTGWLKMGYKGESGVLTATFVGNNITTKVLMTTAGPTMNVEYEHQANDGAISTTQSVYTLSSLN